jgi:hypothetical protein
LPRKFDEKCTFRKNLRSIFCCFYVPEIIKNIRVFVDFPGQNFILNYWENQILNLKFVKNSTENQVIQEILMKIIKKFIKRWYREGEFLSWSEYSHANIDSEFIYSL